MIAVPNYVSPEEYLDIERQNPIRHEYRRGLVYAMAGGSDNHARITINLLSILNAHLSGSHCRLYNGDVKVNYRDTFYYYPDAFVTCDPRDRDDRYIKRYPKLIVEVLSSSTQTFDAGEKFEDYKNLDSLEEYVLISQDSQRVECRRRTAVDTWETVVYAMGDGTLASISSHQVALKVTLKSVALEFAISELYRGLDG